MTLRLTPDEDTALTLLAQAQGISKQEAAKRAIGAEARRFLAVTEAQRIVGQITDNEMNVLRSLL